MAELDPLLEKAADACELWAREGCESAMNQFNVKPAGFAPKKSPGESSETDAASNGAA